MYMLRYKVENERNLAIANKSLSASYRAYRQKCISSLN